MGIKTGETGELQVKLLRGNAVLPSRGKWLGCRLAMILAVQPYNCHNTPGVKELLDTGLPSVFKCLSAEADAGEEVSDSQTLAMISVQPAICTYARIAPPHIQG